MIAWNVYFQENKITKHKAIFFDCLKFRTPEFPCVSGITQKNKSVNKQYSFFNILCKTLNTKIIFASSFPSYIKYS